MASSSARMIAASVKASSATSTAPATSVLVESTDAPGGSATGSTGQWGGCPDVGCHLLFDIGGTSQEIVRVAVKGIDLHVGET